MAYDPKNLSALTYANGFTLWHYRTPDLPSEVDNLGYFNEAARMLRVGDFIFVNAAIDSAPSHGVMVVVANDGTSVDVTNLTPFGSTNAD